MKSRTGPKSYPDLPADVAGHEVPLGVEAATMVAMIDRLVKAGLLAREPSTHDRRVKLVLLTEAGVQMYGKVKAEATRFRNELLADIDPQKLLVATELLEHLQGVTESAS